MSFSFKRHSLDEKKKVKTLLLSDYMALKTINVIIYRSVAGGKLFVRLPLLSLT